VDPRNPQSALTGCNSDRDVGLTGKPAPQIDEGPEIAREGPGWRPRKGKSAGHPEREGFQAGEARRVSCPIAARKGSVGERSSPEEGFCPSRGAGRSALNEGESLQDGGSGGTDDPRGSEGGAPSPKGSESYSWWSAHDREAAMPTGWWEVRPPSPGQTGAGGETDLPGGESQP